MVQARLYRVYKKCPKIASTLDIAKNCGYFSQPRVIRILLVYLGPKIISPCKFMLPGGAYCRLILEWLAHKNVNLKMGCYSIGYKCKKFLTNCQNYRKNGAG